MNEKNGGAAFPRPYGQQTFGNGDSDYSEQAPGMTKEYTTEDLVLTTWRKWRSSADGLWAETTIQSAALIFIGCEIRTLNQTMTLIRQDLLSLGKDGLHDVIKAEAYRVREARRKRLARARARRQALKGVK